MEKWSFFLQLSTFLVTVIVLLTTLWTFHKVRKIRLSSYQLLNDASEARRESRQLFAQLQALWELEKTPELSRPLPPLRGWAGSPDFLLTVADRVLTHQPTTVVECSSGVSTLIVARCLQINGVGHVYSLEHEHEYVQKTQKMLKTHGVEDWATVLHAPLIESDYKTPWYDDSVLPANLGMVDMLVVDGPPRVIAPLARLPALPRFLPKMADTVVVVLDDAGRPQEKEIVRRWKEMAPSFESTYLNHEKGCAVLERQSASTPIT